MIQVYHPTLKQMHIKIQHFKKSFLRLYSLEFWASKYTPFLGVRQAKVTSGISMRRDQREVKQLKQLNPGGKYKAKPEQKLIQVENRKLGRKLFEGPK